MILAIATFATKDDALACGKEQLKRHLIAGYNLWPVESAFWQGDTIIERSEVVLMMKTTIRWFDDIAELIKVKTGYARPEVMSFDSERIEPYFQKWLNDAVK